MQIRSDAAFQEWLAEAGIGVDPRYPDSDELVFQADPELWRFWFPSCVPSGLPGFISTVAKLAAGDGTRWLYRRGGGEWDSGLGGSSDEVIDRLLPAAGLPPGCAGALGFEKNEWQPLAIVIATYYVFGWHVGNDVFLVPDDRSCVLMFGHHGEMSCCCGTQARLDAFVAGMEAAGHTLPEELQDGTFKRPEWMRDS